MVVLDRIPKRLGIPSRGLNTVHLGNKPPQNAEQREDHNVVKHTSQVSLNVAKAEDTRRNRVYA